MNAPATPPLITVKLREATVALLWAQRNDDGETLDAVVARLARIASSVAATFPGLGQTVRSVAAQPRRSRDSGEKYAHVMLGETFHAGTLGEMLAKVIDTLVALDPATVERLAAMRSRKRAFVAKDCKAIYLGRPDLPTLETSSGWWISSNIGVADIERTLRAACKASGLRYGRDIAFLGGMGSGIRNF
ncbi:hypothetical protein R3X27_23385 [Tropicimonas sp. TH_r6]|uniref:hypothetical protein n=1 Tax=Tropicimonas sp. TH_r6 TaxID=3082085 RepID=UPI00295522FD|nr:hypothetical protein [Tropicimonas sp. TH_r6]MDV7145637.1 hypothetical protein [Tropicimonas sp. TH_r6]